MNNIQTKVKLLQDINATGLVMMMFEFIMNCRMQKHKDKSTKQNPQSLLTYSTEEFVYHNRGDSMV